MKKGLRVTVCTGRSSISPFFEAHLETPPRDLYHFDSGSGRKGDRRFRILDRLATEREGKQGKPNESGERGRVWEHSLAYGNNCVSHGRVAFGWTLAKRYTTKMPLHENGMRSRIAVSSRWDCETLYAWNRVRARVPMSPSLIPYCCCHPSSPFDTCRVLFRGQRVTVLG